SGYIPSGTYAGQYVQVYTGAPTSLCPYGTDQYGVCMALPTQQSNAAQLSSQCAAQGGTMVGTTCEVQTTSTPVSTSASTPAAAASGTCTSGYSLVTI